MANVALRSEGGRPYVSSISYANYRSRINDGVSSFPGDSGPDHAWSSASERLPQWAAVVLARPARLENVRIHWGRKAAWTTSRRFEVQGWFESQWRCLANVERSSPEQVTEVRVPVEPVDAIRIRQEPGGGPEGDTNRMCVAELEAHGKPASETTVDHGRIRDAMDAEWEDAFREMRGEATAGALARMGAVEKREGGTGPIGEAERARARRNAASTGWGREVADRILADANWWLDKDDDFIYEMIPVENPRAISPSYERGCPIHGGGRKCMQTNTALPYRWQCVIGGEWWYNGAEVENPTTGETVEVWDDGDGWIAPEGFADPGTVYHFQAGWRYYVLSKLFYHPYELTIDSDDAYTGQNAITQLSLAYAITDDERYAHKVGVLLNRLAEVYRYYNGTVDEQRPLTRGYLVQVSWEEMPIHDCLVAYDLVLDTILRDVGLVEYFREKGGCDYNGDGREDAEDIRYNIQHNLFGYMYEWLHRAMAIQKGDYVVREGLVLWALGHVFANRALVEEAVDGPHGLAVNLTNNTFRDGKWWYDSPGYAVGSVTQPALQRLLSSKGGELLDDPRLRIRELVEFCIRIDCDGRLPGIGDTGGSDSREKVLNPYASCRIEELALIHTGEDGYASRLAAISEGDLNKLRARYADPHTLFHSDPIGDGASRCEPESVVFHDSGFAILRTGSDIETRKHVVLNYGKGNGGHGHKDKLAINMIAHGYDLSADLGYPTTFTHKKVEGWETHTMSHATVCVDGKAQQFATGSLGFTGRTPGTQALCATGERAYPGVADLYRRTVCLVEANGTEAYLFDVFEVSGGETHDYVFRSLSGDDGSDFEIAFEGEARTEVQEGGSLAGPDVAFGERQGAGYIRDVTRTVHDGCWQATWRVGNEDDTGIRLSMLGDAGREIFTGKGEGYGFFGKSPWDACVISRSRPGDGRRTAFAGIYEPFQVSPFIRQVTGLDVTGGIGARVELDGRTDYLIYRTDDSAPCRAEIEGTAVVLDGRLGRVTTLETGEVQLHLIHGRALCFADTTVQIDPLSVGRVTGVDPFHRTGRVVVSLEAPPSVGEVTIFKNPDYVCHSSYEVLSVAEKGPGSYEIDLNMSLVLSEGTILFADEAGGAFTTDTCLTKMEMCPGMFSGKAVYVDGVRRGTIASVSAGDEDLANRVFASGVQTDVATDRKVNCFRLAEGADLSGVGMGSRFLVCDLDLEDDLEAMRSAFLEIAAE
jgi:hypothetical protein